MFAIRSLFRTYRKGAVSMSPREFNVVSVLGGFRALRVGGGTFEREGICQGWFVLTSEGKLSLPDSRSLARVSVGDHIIFVQSEVPIAGDRSAFFCSAWQVRMFEGAVALAEPVPFEASQLPQEVFGMLKEKLQGIPTPSMIASTFRYDWRISYRR